MGIYEFVLNCLQEELSANASDQNKATTPTDMHAEPGLPSLENERRRVIIQAQDQLRGPMQQRDKYVALFSDGQGTE